MIGRTISHYKILEELGRGGMGIVYKVEDTRLKRLVALKFLPPELTRDADAKARFIREARSASSLDHQNICTIHEIAETEDGQLFIVMGYYEGETLKDKIKDKRLKIKDILDIALQIAQGLSVAHSKGIIHRDIKCDNILITHDQNVKILDFGLAKLNRQTRLTMEGTTLGTISYMSPEQAQGQAIDARTDIWSLGVVMYEMVCGQLPFRGEYDQAIVYSLLHEEPEPPTALRSDVPMELERIIFKMLAKKPEERYQRLDDLIVDLKALRNKADEKAEKVNKTAIEKKSSRIKKNKRFPIALAFLLIAAVGIFFWLKQASQPILSEQPGKKIAVLPLVNLTGDPSQEYFCDGMTEQLITNLSRLPELKVISRTSVMRYKNTQKDIRHISDELDVNYVLEGSIRKSAERIRVTVQLIETDEGTHLWANDYDRRLKDIFAIQDDVSQSIARALDVVFSDKALNIVRAGYSTNIAAYEAHLETRYFINNVYLQSGSENDFRRALQLAKRAVQLDPDHYLPYLDLAYLYENRWVTTGDDEIFKQELLYLRKAYRLNPHIPETNAALAMVLFRNNQQDSTFYYLKKALALPGNTWEVYHLIGTALGGLYLFKTALPYYNKALELNPFSFYTLTNRGWACLMLGETDKALADFIKVNQLQPNWSFSAFPYSLALILKGQYQQADSLLKFAENWPGGFYAKSLRFGRALYFAKLGEKEKALATNRWPGVLAVLGMKNEAVAAIDRFVLNREPGYYLLEYLPLTHLPIYDNLRDDPLFRKIVRREKIKYDLLLEKYRLLEKL